MDRVTLTLWFVSFVIITSIGLLIYFIESEDSKTYPIVDMIIVESGRGRSDEQVKAVQMFAPWAKIHVIDTTDSLILDDDTVTIHRSYGSMSDLFMRMSEFTSSENALFLGDTTLPKRPFTVSELYFQDKQKVSQVYTNNLTSIYVDENVQPLVVVQLNDLPVGGVPLDYISYLILIEGAVQDEGFTQDVFVTDNEKAQTAQFIQATNRDTSNIFFTIHTTEETGENVVTKWLDTRQYLQ